MATRRRLIAAAAVIGAGVAACSSSSSSQAPTTSGRPPSVVGSSSGVGSSGTGGTGSLEAPPGCPSTRESGAPVADLTEAIVRERTAGVYRLCSGGNVGIEVRIEPAPCDRATCSEVDPPKERIVWYGLDHRFVRDGMTGWIEILSCNAASCESRWHAEGRDTIEVELRLWLDPTVIQLFDATAFEGSQEWVRVAD